MIEIISPLIHFTYLSLYFVYLKFLKKYKKEKIIFILLLVYFFLPGRFSTLQLSDIYLSKIYIFIFLFPLFLREIFVSLENFFYKKKHLNYSIFLILIPISYLILYFLKDKGIIHSAYKIHFKNYFLDLVTTIMFLIYLFNNVKIDLSKLNSYVKKFIYIASCVLIIELLIYFIFKFANIQFYDRSGTFNSIFLSSFLVTSLFAGIAFLFLTHDLFKNRNFWNLPFVITLPIILLVNIESRAIILSIIITSLFLMMILFKRNILWTFSIIFFCFIVLKISFNFNQCTYFESNIFKILNNFKIKSKNLCDYESSYYRVGLLQRELDVILTNLPFGVGPGVGKFYFNSSDTNNYFYPNSPLQVKLRQVYADIIDVHFENSQLLPSQPSNILSDVLMSYGINIMLLVFFFYKFVKLNYGIKKNIVNIYSICILFIILNFVFNSTSGLIMLQILMTLLALSYKDEDYVKKI